MPTMAARFLVSGVDDSPTAHLQGKVVGGAALPLKVVCQPLVPGSLPVQCSLEGGTGVPLDGQLKHHHLGRFTAPHTQ